MDEVPRFLRHKKYLVILSFIVLLCQCQDDFQSVTGKKRAFTNRSSKIAPQTVKLIQLATPALLDGSYFEGEKLVIQENQKLKLLAEQQRFEKKLQDLSPQIKVLFRYRFVLNGFALVVPSEFEAALESFSEVTMMESSQVFQT